MISANISLKNMEGFDAQIDEVIDAIDANLGEVASVVLAAAKSSPAFRNKTGNLRGRISKKKSRYPGGGYVVEARAPHAHLVEYGHVMLAWGHVTGKRVPAHPFMRPAKEQGIRRAVELFRVAKR